MINLCKIKYSETEYSLSQEEYLNIGRRVESFRSAIQTHYGIVPTLITTFGLSRGMYADYIHATVVLLTCFPNDTYGKIYCLAGCSMWKL